MKLFKPGNIGNLSIKNRIIMAPMGFGGLGETDGRLSQRVIDYYVARAKGGTGLIITGVARVSRRIEQFLNVPLLYHPMIDNIVYTSRLSDLAEAVHDFGTKIAIQLTAGFGRVTTHYLLKDAGAVAPSILPCFYNPDISARELTKQEIEGLVKDFESGAEIIRSSGIDAVELHAHEGYLFDQFQTALWNKRTDKYGGNIEGRLTFSLEVIDAIKKGAGTDFPIIYRFGLTHYLNGGREIDEGLDIARRLEAAGVDALHIDAGCYENWYWPHPPTYLPPGCMVEMAEKVKKQVKIPVIAVGKLGYPEIAEEILLDEKADFIALGRPLLADPEWPRKVKEGRFEDICPCIGDHEGCLGRVRERKSISCTVNPSTGMEKEFAIKLAEKKKSVLIVGGGPGGMEAAMVAKLRGHEVTLWEKNDTLGGNLIPASVPDFKQDYRDLIKYFSTQIKKLGVTVELKKEATPDLIKQMKPDVTIIATGATPVIPEIPGISRKKVITAPELLLSKEEIVDPVVVVGGGVVGCETSLYLAQKGNRIKILEILDSIATDMFSANRMYLLKLIADTNVGTITGAKILEITEEGVLFQGKGGKDFVEANTIVLAVGLRPNKQLLEILGNDVSEVYAIGDCVKPRKVYNAIREGFRTAHLIC